MENHLKKILKDEASKIVQGKMRPSYSNTNQSQPQQQNQGVYYPPNYPYRPDASNSWNQYNPPPSHSMVSNHPNTGYPPAPIAQPVGYPLMYPVAPTQPGAQGYSTMTQTSYTTSAGPISYAGDPMMPMNPNIKVEISVACTSLKNKDLFSKSDPLCILYEKRNGKWAEKDRTEMIHNNLNPQWQKKFCLSYHPIVPHQIKFEIYDWDTKATKVEKQDFLGSAEISIQKILTDNHTKGGCQLLLKNGGQGKIIINAEEIKPFANTKIKMQLMGHKLDKKDFLGKSDPYYILKKQLPTGEWTIVYKSEFVEKDVNPKWNAMEKSMNEICSGDYDRDIKIEIYDHDKRGKDDLIGEFVTTLRSLMAGASNNAEFEIVNPERKQKKKNYTNSGTISVLYLQFE